MTWNQNNILPRAVVNDYDYRYDLLNRQPFLRSSRLLKTRLNGSKVSFKFSWIIFVDKLTMYRLKFVIILQTTWKQHGKESRPHNENNIFLLMRCHPGKTNW